MSRPPHGERRADEVDATGRQHPHPGFIRYLLEAQKRERDYVLHEIFKARGLMPLLMKQRNGYRWTAAERQELKGRLNALSHISPYLVALAVPGSLLMLPVLAWWLDRRRKGRS